MNQETTVLAHSQIDRAVRYRALADRRVLRTDREVGQIKIEVRLENLLLEVGH